MGAVDGDQPESSRAVHSGVATTRCWPGGTKHPRGARSLLFQKKPDVLIFCMTFYKCQQQIPFSFPSRNIQRICRRDWVHGSRV